ncbi:MAG: DNA repair protein RecO, partial [Parvularculaceae bacterium]|nr:DNA repair protein RecO [Parvularculaceae bacterium]
ALELTRARAAALLDDRLALAGLSAAVSLTRAALHEREAHGRLHAALSLLLDSLDAAEIWPALYARYELGLLAELGFGLSLDRCVASGATQDLVYVSPRSAGAVSSEAGAPYAQKLLPCPAFLRDAAAEAGPADVVAALTTTGYFLETRVLHPLGVELPEARARLISLLTAAAS